jgi:P-type E1-E2 ATPase
MTLREVDLSLEVQGHISRMQQQAISPLCVAKDGHVIGLLSISDPLRPEARDVVQALRDRGIKRIIMITGDHQDVARRIAEELGITEYMAEVFPGDKSEAVQRLQREG